jgi:hypothetical protein
VNQSQRSRAPGDQARLHQPVERLSNKRMRTQLLRIILATATVAPTWAQRPEQKDKENLLTALMTSRFNEQRPASLGGIRAITVPKASIDACTLHADIWDRAFDKLGSTFKFEEFGVLDVDLSQASVAGPSEAQYREGYTPALGRPAYYILVQGPMRYKYTRYVTTALGSSDESVARNDGTFNTSAQRFHFATEQTASEVSRMFDSVLQWCRSPNSALERETQELKMEQERQAKEQHKRDVIANVTPNSAALAQLLNSGYGLNRSGIESRTFTVSRCALTEVMVYTFPGIPGLKRPESRTRRTFVPFEGAHISSTNTNLFWRYDEPSVESTYRGLDQPRKSFQISFTDPSVLSSAAKLVEDITLGCNPQRP